MGNLTAKFCDSAAVGTHEDGDGLRLVVSPRGRRWLLRITVKGKRREIGLGSYGKQPPGVSLAEARRAVSELRGKVAAGLDPFAPDTPPPTTPTFTQAAARYIRQHRRGWSNRKHARQWVSTLKTYARPVIGKMTVDTIKTEDVLSVLSGIWTDKNETAKRVQGRIENILDAEAALGHRHGDNPARWRGHLQRLLPAPRKVQKVRHQPAMPWAEVPAFIAEVAEHTGISALALQWLVRTCTRTDETLGATWSEIDRSAKLWTIPAHRMKARRPHEVPLTDACLALLDKLPRMAGSDWLFPSVQQGKRMSNMSLLQLMRGMGHGVGGNKSDYVPHGFRSSFRQWAGETTPHPREVIEHCLAHAVEDATERAYQRSTLLLKRRKVMEDWNDYLDRPPAKIIHLSQPQVTAEASNSSA